MELLNSWLPFKESTVVTKISNNTVPNKTPHLTRVVLLKIRLPILTPRFLILQKIRPITYKYSRQMRPRANKKATPPCKQFAYLITTLASSGMKCKTGLYNSQTSHGLLNMKVST